MPLKTVYFIPLVSSLLPWILLVLILFFRIVYDLSKGKNFMEIFEKFISIMIITIFSIQPSIINYLLNIIGCVEVDKGEFYVSTYLDEKCSTATYYSWIYRLFIPSFVFYGCLLPIAAFAYMKYNEPKLHERIHVKKIGFLSSGYKKKKFYWYFFILFLLINNFSF